ncbi:MAG: hypothetical protein ABW252_11960 [Polyangiales bacterium]
MLRRAIAASLAVSVSVGCSAGISCPEGRHVQGDACVCAEGAVDFDGRCVASTPPDGEVDDAPRDGGRDAGARDAGRTRRDAGVRVDAGDARDAGATDAAVARDAAEPPPPVPPPVTPCPMSCVSGRCDARGRCTEVAASTCGDRVVAPDERCTREQERPEDCYGCAPASCGDGVVQPDVEDCELRADGSSAGASGWAAQNCDRATCRRKMYQPCTVTVDDEGSHDPCSDGGELLACIDGICTAPSCRFDVPASECMLESCAALPGSTVSGALGWCFIECDLAHPCPYGLLCHLSYGRCIGPSHVRFARCGDLNERIEGGCPL